MHSTILEAARPLLSRMPITLYTNMSLLTLQVCGNGRAAAELRAWLQEWRPRQARAAGEATLIGSDSDGEWYQVVTILLLPCRLELRARVHGRVRTVARGLNLLLSMHRKPSTAYGLPF